MLFERFPQVEPTICTNIHRIHGKDQPQEICMATATEKKGPFISSWFLARDGPRFSW
jgi:hypothetical protein